MAKINIPNRFKNKATLTALIATGALLANQICLLFGVDYSAQIEQLVNISGTILLALSAMGIVVDPNSKGVSDTGIALEYTEPRDENKNPVEFMKPEGSDTLKPGEMPVLEEGEEQDGKNTKTN